eukprot:CAMPEP_0176069590 /NCGR_PEP_ID=MMETSP0120_2-20121206/34747_1 /TAXON_ID=160619 /ORGANISM="Kryptoperidinium foliaceum, Strain CCMP 1326" /LENGTH=307 /DNA_ID=CAMNT_0017403227 /DNA_START=91 /DNA_END=1014 /DNA_ORIENTATION=+
MALVEQAAPAGLPSKDTIADHYNRHNDNETYDSAWFYSDPAYQAFLADAIRDEFYVGADGQVAQPDSFREREVILDIGCGNGTFTRLLADGCGTASPAYGFDPFLSPQTGDNFVSLPSLGAIEFARTISDVAHDAAGATGTDKPVLFSKVLLKEVVHHINDDFGEFCQKIAEYFRTEGRSNPNCQLLIATRLAEPKSYPFFESAKEAWRSHQMDAQVYVDSMKANGFTTVRQVVKGFRVEMPVQQWKQMVRNRFWSNFGDLSDQQIAQGLEEMGDFKEFQKEGDPSTLVFYDNFVFITGQVDPAQSN